MIPRKCEVEAAKGQSGMRCLKLFGAAPLLFLGAASADTKHIDPEASARFEVTLAVSPRQEPVTGRLFVMISPKAQPEVRLQDHWFNSPEFLGVDIHQWKAGRVVAVDGQIPGYPFASLRVLPPGDYYVQAAFTPYMDYHRADGHTIWAVNQWEGQRFLDSPDTLYGPVQKIHLDPSQLYRVPLSLTQRVPLAAPPADTEWIRHVKIRSELLSRFWGRPIYIGAIVLLPRGYESHPNTRYPVIYQQQAHFSPDAPFGFTTDDKPESADDRQQRESRGYETGYAFYCSWASDHFPRVIAVALQHPTPFGDLSGAINSANNGPYGDAIATELIPYIENHFRAISSPLARMLVGKSAGGRDAFAQQLFHPDFYGGAWIFHPWAFDYQHYFVVDIYRNRNAYEIDAPQGPPWKGFWNGVVWAPLERNFARSIDGQPLVSVRQLSQHDALMAGTGPGGEFGADDAINGPVGPLGYPQPLWDRVTGKIDPKVASYWGDHGDLTHLAQKLWPDIGPKLAGKLHFFVGDMDEFYRNLGVHHLEDTLNELNGGHLPASFEYAPLKGHGWQPMTNAELVKTIADTVAQHAMPGSPTAWRAE
jgi:Putative esterase